MDTTKEKLVEEQLAELREALREINLSPEDLTIKNTGAVSGVGGYESATVTLGSTTGKYNNTVIGGGFTVSTSLGSNASPYYSTTSSISGSNWNTGANITAKPWSTTNQAGRFELSGPNADLIINGVSILNILKDRLNVMIPNPALEKEWDELKVLGDQYRALEAKLKEQGEMWAKLKSMPPSNTF